MKKIPINQLLLFLACISLMLQSCQNSDAKSIEYVNTIGDKSVRLNLLNGKDYLTYDTPTRVDFEWTNIDPHSVMIGGAGIKMLGVVDSSTQTEFTVTKEGLKTDTLHITMILQIDGKRRPTSFHVPVRTKE